MVNPNRLSANASADAGVLMGPADTNTIKATPEASADGTLHLPHRAFLELPFHHRDPVDRLIVAQAKSEGMTLITCDPRMTAYGIPILW